MIRHNWKKQHALILTGSFLIPVILMGAYFAYRQMAPFGPSSLLTVDLGQQYVDFFAYLRNIILHHPGSLFYSFSKGLGGEMLGTNAYYLFSPLNLILIFFPGKWLTSGVMALTLLRYGLAGMAFAWLLLKTRLQSGFRIWAFSTAYALNGWMIANQLNIIWLDALVILPLIIWGLLRLIHDGHPGTYIAWLAVMMIDNYYMAWMICLFTILVVCWQLPTLADWRTRLKTTGVYLASSIASAGIAAVTLLPTIYALTTSKGTYTEAIISSKLEYQPLKILGKLVPGSFDFNQMPSGQPNIYIGMLPMIGAALYFFNVHIKWSQRLVAGLVTIFFILSFCYEPLDLLWHAGQFPVWYPYRFSFIFAFWCILLAARVLQPSYQLQWPGALAILIISGLVFWVTGQLKLAYLSTSQRLIGLGFVVVSLAALMIARRNSPRLYDFLIVLIVACDVGTSAFTSLNKISYVSQAEFGKYTQQLDQASQQLKHHDSGFYRVAKTFMRTKDDPMQGDFYSADHFGSTLEPPIPAFMGAIGQPAGDGFVSYDNGTQVSDALLGFKYTMTARHHGIEDGEQIMPLSGYRPDWARLKKVNQTRMITSRENPAALPIAFGASSEIFQLGKATLDPLGYQSQIFQALAGRPINQPLFIVQNFTSVSFNNVQAAHQITGTTFKKQNLLKPATIKLKFTPPTNDSYYLTLGPEVKDSASISLNRRDFSQYDTYRDTVVINLAHHQKGKPVTITFRLKKTSAWLQNVSVYRLNQRAFNASLSTLQQSPLKIQKATPTSIKGTVHIHRGQSALMTTIPAAAGWHVRIDGHRVQPRSVISTFMALPITSGTHRVGFYYRPPFLILGVIVTVVSLGLTWYITKRQR